MVYDMIKSGLDGYMVGIRDNEDGYIHNTYLSVFGYVLLYEYNQEVSGLMNGVECEICKDCVLGVWVE